MNFLDLFACILREKRELMKVTQRDLADKLGMCNRTIMEIEGSIPSYSMIRRHRRFPSVCRISSWGRARQRRSGILRFADMWKICKKKNKTAVL